MKLNHFRANKHGGQCSVFWVRDRQAYVGPVPALLIILMAVGLNEYLNLLSKQVWTQHRLPDGESSHCELKM